MVENCEIADTGTNGVYLSGTECTVKNSLIHDIGSTGISISGGVMTISSQAEML